MKKKVLSILLTVVLAFSAVGCGGNTNTGSTNESTESTGAGADQTDSGDNLPCLAIRHGLHQVQAIVFGNNGTY